MLTVLARTLMTATRTEDTRDQWSGRFVPPERQRMEDRKRYRFSPYRDLW